MSIRCPRRLAASRRVRNRSSGSERRAIACFGLGDLGRGHLREIFFLQDFTVGDGQPRVDLNLGFVLTLVDAAEQRFLDALGARRRWFGRCCRRARQHGGDQLFDIAALAEEDAERLVEQDRVLMPLHEHSVQRPVEILAVADLCDVERFQRIEYRAGPDWKAGGAQRARKVENIFGETTVGHRSYSAARNSDFTSSSSALTLLPSSRAMSS